MHARLPPEIVEAIQAAPATEPAATTAKRLSDQFGRNVGPTSVKKYRRAAREQRAEIAREVLSRHVERSVGGALQDLTELRGLAGQHYRESGDHRDGQLWLASIRTEVEHVGLGEMRDEFDGWTDEELERYAAAGEPRGAAAASEGETGTREATG